MLISVPQPIESLVLDPFAGRAALLPAVPENANLLQVEGAGIREKVARLEQSMRGSGQEIELPVKHHFARGVYVRELFIPKGTALVGKIHKYSQVNIVSKGDISVLTEDGIKRVQAGATIVSCAGIKRAGYAHEDTIWVTIHGTHETDVDRLEDELIAESFDEYDAFCAAITQGELSWHG